VSHALAEALALFGAGLAAGTINTAVGSGTLITFPTLLAFGYQPVIANVSNTVGLVPGVVSGVYGYRPELAGQRGRLKALGSASLSGGVTGAILLLTLPADAFKAIVPVLIGIALVMVIVQPRMAAWVAARQRARDAGNGAGGEADLDSKPGSFRIKEGSGPERSVGPVLWLLIFCTGVYGGYFGAAQGVLLIGLLGIAYNDGLQRVNAAKNVLAGLVNGVAALVFIVFSHVAWGAAGLIAVGSIIGGQIGARVGRQLPPWGLRLLIVCVGSVALVKLLV
jgi:hypothetical protein